MTVLGEAFIEVRSDLRPFIRDLDKEVKRAADNIEKQLKDSITSGLSGSGDSDGEKLGEKLGDGVGRGMERRLGDKKKPPYITIASALASALDDGISALPTEVKAGIVTGLLLAVPFVSAALSGAVAAGLGAGLAGVGTLLAFQFTEVEDAGKSLVNELRTDLVEATQPFVGVLLGAFKLIESRFDELRPRLERIFASSSELVGPLVEGVLDLFDFLTESIDNVRDDLKPFVKELANGFALLGFAIGEALEILVNTGEEGEEGLRDLFGAVTSLIIGAAQLLAIFTEIYGFLRDIAVEVPIIGGLFTHIFGLIDRASEGTDGYGLATDNMSEKILGSVDATKAQEKALKEAAAAMDKARDAAFGLIDATLDYEDSIDSLSDTLKENGKTLSQETEAGRENLRALGDSIKAAQRNAEERLAQGKISASEARILYQQEIDEILRIARAHGISEQAIRGVYDEAIRLVNIPQADTGWLSNITSKATLSAQALERAVAAAQRLRSGSGGVGGGKGPGGFTEFAEGGFALTPTQAIVGEAGPEVIIPLTKPSRAAQLMAQSGLGRMFGAAASLVQVFIGNEQLDSHMVRIVESNNAALSNSLAFGARGL